MARCTATKGIQMSVKLCAHLLLYFQLISGECGVCLYI